MRKLYAIAVLAGCLSVLGNQAIAAVEDCEELKGKSGSNGLYGMCVAYWNSVDNNGSSGSETRIGQEGNKFLDRYNDIRDRVGGPPMPGLESEFDCPCWDIEFLAEITVDAIVDDCGEVSYDEVSFQDIAIFDDFDLQLMAGSPFSFMPAQCSVLAGEESIAPIQTDEQQTSDCKELLRGLKDLFDEAGMVCPGW
jgi:hypothetical protein